MFCGTTVGSCQILMLIRVDGRCLIASVNGSWSVSLGRCFAKQRSSFLTKLQQRLTWKPTNWYRRQYDRSLPTVQCWQLLIASTPSWTATGLCCRCAIFAVLPDRSSLNYSLRPRRHNKTLITKQANSMNVILLLEIFTRTYTDIHKYWNYLLVFSFVHN